MKEYYDFENLEIKEESEEDKKRRKQFISIASLFLAFLMLSFVIPHEVVQSLAVSSKLAYNQIEFNNIKIIFNNDVANKLTSFYIGHQFTEFKLCLTGNVTNNTYYVNEFYQPKVFFASPISVHSLSCNQETILDLHSHPLRDCRASEQDLISYQSYKRRNQSTIAMVMCDVNRFGFYGY